jgi:hypothetical protein
MQVVSENYLLLDALAAWGAHEADGRARDRYPIDISDKYACANFIMWQRAPYVSHILSRNPHPTALLVELDANEFGVIRLANGLTLEQWIEQADADATKHFRRLCDAPESPQGPLVGACYESFAAPIMLYDGWHRAAAWFERCRTGRPSTITSYLIRWAKV